MLLELISEALSLARYVSAYSMQSLFTYGYKNYEKNQDSVGKGQFPVWLWKHEVMQPNRANHSTHFLFPAVESGRRGKAGTCGEG